MSLRYGEEEEPLSAETTRAFLQVHAEREARVQATPPDAPTVADLAESLHLSREETEAILREARARVARTSKPVARSRPSYRLAVAAGSVLLAGLLLLSLGTVQRNLTVAPPMSVMASPPTMVDPGTALANGFEIRLTFGNAGESTQEGLPPKFGTSYRNLSFETAAAVRGRLVERILNIATAVDLGRSPSGVGSLTVRLRVAGGKETSILVPVPPYTFPLAGNPGAREALQESVAKVLDAAWPAVVEATPQ